MNKQRKKIVLYYIVFLCVLALFFFLIVGYAISQKHIASFADFFKKATDKEERFWIRMAFVAIMNLFAFSSVIFIGLLIFLKRKWENIRGHFFSLHYYIGHEFSVCLSSSFKEVVVFYCPTWIYVSFRKIVSYICSSLSFHVIPGKPSLKKGEIFGKFALWTSSALFSRQFKLSSYHCWFDSQKLLKYPVQHFDWYQPLVI